MSKWLKNLMRKWLGINDLEHNVKSGTSTNTQMIMNVSNRVMEIEKLVQLGVDVHQKSGSWAVICIAGNVEYVRFVELSLAELRSVQKFLRQFPEAHKIVDKPQFIKNIWPC